jgi:nucleoside-diphosphate-sugar epimerase
MTDGRTALVLGATGGIGGEVAETLLRRGWTVRALHRDPARVRAIMPAARWIAGDAMSPDSVRAAAAGATLIVHAVNPPRYRRWAELVLPMLESSIGAARASGARILLPGTVYNYGPDAFPLLREDSPQHPTTRKGAIRAEMERRLQQAAGDGVRTLVVRAGDFFGPRGASTWFAQALVKAGRPVRLVTNPGRPDTGHGWAYLPDLAEAMLQLLERDPGEEGFRSFHFGGHWDEDGTQMIAAIRRVVGAPAPRLRRFPWALVTALSPVVPFFREMQEMRYLWREPLRLDNTRLREALGEEPHTPLDVAVRDTLAAIGCLDAAAGPASRPVRSSAGRSAPDIPAA